jgi:repressor LexA
MEKPGFSPRVIQGDRTDPPKGALPVSAVHALELPVMGRIAAGVPIEAISEVSHHVAVPGSMLSGKGQHYALEVKGDSMIEAGINDGDIVVIREQNSAENGDIVVALVEDHEATLKRFRRKGNMIALEAANPAYETRVFPDHLVKVQGRLVGLIRSY